MISASWVTSEVPWGDSQTAGTGAVVPSSLGRERHMYIKETKGPFVVGETDLQVLFAKWKVNFISPSGFHICSCVLPLAPWFLELSGHS